MTERSGPIADSTAATSAGNQSELAKVNAEQKKEVTILRDQLRIAKKEHELELLNVKSAQAEELKRL